MAKNVPQIHTAEFRAYRDLKVTMTLPVAQQLVNLIVALPPIVERWGLIDIEVNNLTGMTRDTLGWSNNRRHEIRLRAAGRQFRTILHEISHQYCDLDGQFEHDHGPEFARTHLFVAGSFLGPRFEERLRNLYDDCKVVY